MGSSLFDPVLLGAIEAPNRIIMAPLNRMRAGPGRAPNDLTVRYYSQRASAGLIISEACAVSEFGYNAEGMMGAYAPAQFDAWRAVTKAVHAKGGRIVMQLHHSGRIAQASMMPDGQPPVAPSELQPGESPPHAPGPSGWELATPPRALDTAEVEALVASYAAAAVAAREAGFDGVEIMAANGYLMDQFLGSRSNRRTDRYGGSAANRRRFLLEIIEAIAAQWSADRIGVKLSPGGRFHGAGDEDPVKAAQGLVAELDGAGLAYLHLAEVLAGSLPALPPGLELRERRLAPELRRLFRGPVIVNAGFDGQSAQAALDEGWADAVAFGALFIANPDLPERLRRGAAFNPPDHATFHGGQGEAGYVDYPALDD